MNVSGTRCTVLLICLLFLAGCSEISDREALDLLRVDDWIDARVSLIHEGSEVYIDIDDGAWSTDSMIVVDILMPRDLAEPTDDGRFRVPSMSGVIQPFDKLEALPGLVLSNGESGATWIYPVTRIEDLTVQRVNVYEEGDTKKAYVEYSYTLPADEGDLWQERHVESSGDLRFDARRDEWVLSRGGGDGALLELVLRL